MIITCLRQPVVWTIAILALVFTSAAQAETFNVMLGDRQLGTLSFEVSQSGGARAQTLRTNLDNTPLGVGAGRFEATSRLVRTDAGAVVRQYVGRSRSSSETRDIAFTMDDGRVLETSISPASERTAMSDPAAVPAGVIDLAQTFDAMVSRSDCPPVVNMYDGRRVVQIDTQNADQTGDVLTCTMRYRVVQGPGHLSPFGFKSVAMVLTYDTAQNRLAQLSVSAGGFEVRLQR